jgi:hypothetical protein
MRAKLISLSLAVVSLFAAPGATWAATIELNNSLLNRSFELGVYDNTNGTVTCPVNWTCTNSVGVYSPGAAQYTPGADGLGHMLPISPQPWPVRVLCCKLRPRRW